MVVTAVYGQTHRGISWNITRELIRKLGDVTLREFTVNHIKPCTGCNRCFFEGEEKCPEYCNIKPIAESLEDSDVVILSSPTYCLSVSGQMKTFLDHMAYRWIAHRPHPSMRNKTGIAVSSAAGMGSGKTAGYLASQMKNWGINNTMKLSFNTGSAVYEETSDKIKDKIRIRVHNTASKVNNYKGNRKDFMNMLFFSVMKKMIKNGKNYSEADRKWWEENGLL